MYVGKWCTTNCSCCGYNNSTGPSAHEEHMSSNRQVSGSTHISQRFDDADDSSADKHQSFGTGAIAVCVATTPHYSVDKDSVCTTTTSTTKCSNMDNNSDHSFAPVVQVTPTLKYTNSQLQFNVPLPSLRNLRWAMRLKAFPDYAAHGLARDPKQLSESAGAIRAALRSISHRFCDTGQHSWSDLDGRRTMCLCIGDGKEPYTAALFAFVTHAIDIVSIDPIMKSTWVGTHPRNIRHLTVHRQTVENYLREQHEAQRHATTCTTSDNVMTNTNQEGVVEELIVMLVHSHARLSSFYPTLKELYPRANITTVSVDCCQVQTVPGLLPVTEYDDLGIFSEKRHVKVYEDFVHDVNEP